jgi:hypothetical protein
MNYATLQADVAAYLHRSDLSTVIPSFIEKARIRIGRDLRVLELEQTATLTSPTNSVFTLPAAFRELRRAYSNGIPLRAVNPHELQYWTSLTTPQVYCIRGGTITVPGASTVDIWYFAIEAPLTNGSTEHPTMAAWPQVWLAAAMLEASLYTNDVDALAQWSGVYDAEVAAANRRAERARQGTAPASITSDANVSFFEAPN